MCTYPDMVTINVVIQNINCFIAERLFAVCPDLCKEVYEIRKYLTDTKKGRKVGFGHFLLYKYTLKNVFLPQIISDAALIFLL